MWTRRVLYNQNEMYDSVFSAYGETRQKVGIARSLLGEISLNVCTKNYEFWTQINYFRSVLIKRKEGYTLPTPPVSTWDLEFLDSSHDLISIVLSEMFPGHSWSSRRLSIFYYYSAHKNLPLNFTVGIFLEQAIGYYR